MNDSIGLLDATYDLLEQAAPRQTLPEIAKGAGVGYEWLQKFSQRAVKNPTVTRVQKLHDYLKAGVVQ